MANVENESDVLDHSANSEEVVCGLCLGKQYLNDLVGTLDSCKHSFCGSCLLQWSDNNRLCPVDKLHFSKVTVTHVESGRFMNSRTFLDIRVSNETADEDEDNDMDEEEIDDIDEEIVDATDEEDVSGFGEEELSEIAVEEFSDTDDEDVNSISSDEEEFESIDEEDLIMITRDQFYDVEE